MGKEGLKTPVLLIIFKRPSTTEKVFEAIRAARPEKLFIAANAPRYADEHEKSLSEQARQIATKIDWPCELKTLFRVEYLSCKESISGAINWFFENVEEGIIFEDDCLPDLSFFPFCEELLEKYRNDNRIMMISGDNFRKEAELSPYSYYFTRYNQIWGWATWRRAWKLYDVNMSLWPEIKKQNYLFNVFGDSITTLNWSNTFDKVYNGEIDTWDYQHTFSCFINNGLSINPSINLVSNIGFGIDATHTTSAQHNSANLPSRSIHFPLTHPPFLIRNALLDHLDETTLFHPVIKVKPLSSNTSKKGIVRLSTLFHFLKKITRF